MWIIIKVNNNNKYSFHKSDQKFSYKAVSTFHCICSFKTVPTFHCHCFPSGGQFFEPLEDDFAYKTCVNVDFLISGGRFVGALEGDFAYKACVKVDLLTSG